MGLNDKPDKKKTSTLSEDIRASCEWVVTALNSSGYKVDYTLESVKEIDRFIDEQSGENGIISRNKGQILFSLGCYVGETVIRLYGGKCIGSQEDVNTAASTAYMIMSIRFLAIKPKGQSRRLMMKYLQRRFWRLAGRA